MMIHSHGCALDGSLNQQDFTKPLPTIGIYIAGASLLCLLAMSLDFLHGILRRKPWFPCSCFSLNATSLTFLSIATKLPVDLNSSMPSRTDQLSKLTGTMLICTAMGNFMPSLGTMRGSEIRSNVIALGILVITVIVNVCIQMGTGVIYVFLPEHAIIMFFMLLLLVLFIFSAITVPTTKCVLDGQYNSKFDYVLDRNRGSIDEQLDMNASDGFEYLKIGVERLWMMAHTGSPQYVLGRSATCTAAGAFTLLSAVVLVEAVVRAFLVPGLLEFCNGESDYGWSTWVVFVTQVLVVVVGSFAPVFRWLNAINLRSGDWSCKEEFKVEKYWMEKLEEWKKSTLPFHIGSRCVRIIAYCFKNRILDLVIGMQRLVVWISKFTRLLSILFLTLLNKILMLLCSHFKRSPQKSGSSRGLLDSSVSLAKNEEQMPGSKNENKQHHNLSFFVLHLEGEEALVELISRSGGKEKENWIRKGHKNRPDHLINLFKKYTVSADFKGVLEFDSDKVPAISELGPTLPPNCWALPVVTLSSIAVSLPHPDKERTKLLLQGVRQGLKFVNFIEKNLDTKGLTNMREAAEHVWLRIDIYNSWLDVKLHNLNSDSPKEIIGKLADIGKKRVVNSKEKIKGKPIEWPMEVLAAYSLYRLCETILLDSDRCQTAEKLLDWLEQTNSDLLGACLTNLPRAIYVNCSSAYIEDREERVRNATYILGEARNIPLNLRWTPLKGRYLDEWTSVDEWPSRKSNNPSSLACGYDNGSSSTAGEGSLNTIYEDAITDLERSDH